MTRFERGLPVGNIHLWDAEQQHGTQTTWGPAQYVSPLLQGGKEGSTIQASIIVDIACRRLNAGSRPQSSLQRDCRPRKQLVLKTRMVHTNE